MLTPRFTCTQDDQFVTVVIRVPYVKMAEMEYYIIENEFKFFVKPYFLRLRFEHDLVEDGRERASYDVDKGEITIQLPKAVKGQHFPDLDMLTQLLTKPSKQSPVASGKPLVEVLSSTPAASSSEDALDEEDADEEEDDEAFEWKQQLPEDDGGIRISRDDVSLRYGFNRAYRGVFATIAKEVNLSEVLDCPQPEDMNASERKSARMEQEQQDFDPEHYAAEYLDEEPFESVFDFSPRTAVELKHVEEYRKQWAVFMASNVAANNSQAEDGVVEEAEEPIAVSSEVPRGPGDIGRLSSASSSSSSAAIEDLSQSLENLAVESGKKKSKKSKSHEPQHPIKFTDKEQEALMKLPKKEFLIEDESKSLLGLVDIIFAYAYNQRVTEGENTVESAWNMSKLSCTLSWLDTQDTMKDTVLACLRRSLIYPLYRNFRLSLRCLRDVLDIFNAGKRTILRCLLEIRHLFEQQDSFKYLLNRCYMDDYCIWIQTLDDSRLQRVAQDIKGTQIRKSEVGLHLNEIEEEADREEEEGEDEGADEYHEEQEEEDDVDEIDGDQEGVMVGKFDAEAILRKRAAMGQ